MSSVTRRLKRRLSWRAPSAKGGCYSTAQLADALGTFARSIQVALHRFRNEHDADGAVSVLAKVNHRG